MARAGSPPEPPPAASPPAVPGPAAGGVASLTEEPAGRGQDVVRTASINGAVTALSEPPRADSSAARAHVGRGQALAKKGDLDGALAEFGEAIRLDPKNAQLFKLRALAYAYHNDNDKAIIDWTSAIGLASVGPGRLSNVELFLAYRNRAVLYDVEELFAREIADLTKMIDTYWKDPELADALEKAWGGASTRVFLGSIYRLRAKAYARIAPADKAIEDLSSAITLDRDHAADAYNDRAEIEQKLGWRERAVDDFRAALRLDPNMADAKQALVRLETEAAKRPPGQPGGP